MILNKVSLKPIGTIIKYHKNQKMKKDKKFLSFNYKNMNMEKLKDYDREHPHLNMSI